MRDWESAEIYDVEAERAVFSAALVDPAQMDVIGEIIGPSDFHDPDLGQLWDCLEAIHGSGHPINDTRVLIPELRMLGAPGPVSTVAFLGKLLTDGPAYSAHAVFYAKAIRRLAKLRGQQGLLYRALDRVTARDADPDAIAEWVDARILDTNSESVTQVRSAGDIAKDVITELRTPTTRTGKPIYTGIADIDKDLGGWHPGELVILAARPGNGKTAMAAQIGVYNARREHTVLFVSLEMRDRELLTRTLCGDARVDSREIRRRTIRETQIDELEVSADSLRGVPFYVFDRPRASLSRVRGLAKRQKAQGALDLIVVDYVERMTPPDRKIDRRLQIGEITVGLRTIAKELNCVVLLLAQLRRDADKTRPNIGMLKESGDLEQEADAVYFIHRTGDDKEGIRPVEIIAAKNRNGQKGFVNLEFVTYHTVFRDVEPIREDFSYQGVGDAY